MELYMEEYWRHGRGWCVDLATSGCPGGTETYTRALVTPSGGSLQFGAPQL